ncbi:MAG: hypothetical protein ACRDQZ_15155 [Mycobacteriales bacterium]
MTARPRAPGSGVARARQSSVPGVGPDVVSFRDERRREAMMLREAVGFRVDGPEGRVGVLTAVVPDFGENLPDRIQIATGLFLVASLDVPFGEVVSVDPYRRRVGIGVLPTRRRLSRRQAARNVHRFLRLGGRDASTNRRPDAD